MGGGFWRRAKWIKRLFLVSRKVKLGVLGPDLFEIGILFNSCLLFYIVNCVFQTILFNLVQNIYVPFAKKLSMGTAQQQLFLILKIVLYTVVVISKILH